MMKVTGVNSDLLNFLSTLMLIESNAFSSNRDCPEAKRFNKSNNNIMIFQKKSFCERRKKWEIVNEAFRSTKL